SDFSPLRQPDGELSAVLDTQMAAQAHQDGNRRYEWRYLTCLGNLFWGEVLLTSVTLDHSYVFYAVVRDISARKLAERSLHLAAQVVEHAREAIVVMDQQQNVISMNPAYSESSGFRLEDLRGRPFGLQTVPEQAWDAVQRDGHWQGEIQAPRKAGAPYPAWLSLTAIRDHLGQSGNYLAILNDGGVNFSRADRQAFSLAGFDYSFIAPVSGLPDMQWGELQLFGTLSNGQVISTSLAFPGQGSDGNYHFQSASLLGGFGNYAFTGLTFSACIFNDTGACSNSLDFPAFNQGQFALDNINISAVPEPSTYMLLLAGLGAIGMVARRRAGKSAAFAVQGA
ncbi:MAG: NF038120 family PEP-CTERM protein, partial [Janthinobacterium sp.]